MASLGDRETRKVGDTIVKTFAIKKAGVLQTGLTGTITVTLYDESDNTSTPTVTEPVSGRYQFSFAPDAAGKWKAKMVETSVPEAAYWEWDVESTVLGDRLSSDTGTLATASALSSLRSLFETKTFTVASSSTTTEVRSNTTGSEVNEHYRGTLVLVEDVSAGDVQVRGCRQYFQTNDRFLLDQALTFTPEVGVDIVRVLTLRPGFRLHELLGSNATANAFLASFLDLIMNKDGSQTFDQSTDSLEATADKLAIVEVDTSTMEPIVSARLDVAVSTRAAPGDAMDLVTDAVDGNAVAASGVAEIQAGLATSSALATLQGDVSTLLSRITATLFSGITSLAQWLGLMAGKQVGDSTARTEIRATGAGSGTFDETTDSEEAIRDRGDAAWTTADVAAALAADAGLLKILHRVCNRVDLNPANGLLTVYNDVGVAEFTALAYMDVAQTQLYDGTGPVHSIRRLT